MWHLLMAQQQESFLPFSSRQSLSCCLSNVAKRSTPKPHGPLLFTPSEPRGPLLSPQNLVVLSCSLQNRVAPYLLQNRMVSPSLQSHMVSFSLQSHMVSPYLWLPGLGLNPSSHLPLQPISDSSYSQLHLPASRILPALLGCHSKSGQVWPHGMEPIISKLSRRPCNQGELLPSPILGRIRFHPPGSKPGHSYLTYV